ncbi:STAND family AAA ATPase [Agarivorans sp. Z349TD_8]|uniref:STAND family AAA ATPase n=1 Tax=Agarivorans sp. Z349TD_8 TaxID=3421434 RepID=UPI003D7E3C77
MNNELFVVISDIHAKENNCDEVNRRLTELKEWIKRKSIRGEYSSVAILVAGDIAFSGSCEEYDLIRSSFQSLSDELKIILTPGNHDHDFSKYTGGARDVLISSNGVTFDESVYQIVTAGQQDYFDFESNICNVEASSSTLLSKEFKISNNVSIQTINTAWCSKIHEKGGDLTVPIDQLIEPSGNEEIKVVFFHHPLSWLEPNNHKEVRNFLNSNRNIIISGHEHIENSFKVETDNNKTLIVETCSFHDTNVEDNGFISFSIENEDILIEKHIWEDDRFTSLESKRRSDIVDSSSLYFNGFKVKDSYYEMLVDVGTGFSHPEKDELNIHDIFIYQNVKNLDSNSTTVKRESSQNILSQYPDNNIALSGEESTGKTSLLKKLCLDTLSDGKFSVFLDGSEINKANKFKDNKIEECIKKQYEEFSLDRLLATSQDRLIFIDNFNLIKGDEKSLRNLIDTLRKYFTKIILTVSDSYTLNHDKIKGDDILSDSFVKLEILKLGHASRWDLITKWNNLKNECRESAQELIIKTDHANKEISRVIGKNYIPSTPFYLLTMLQSMDTSISAELNTSSYGHYYHYLITCSLGLAGVKKDKLDGIFTYITEMSYFFYKSEHQELSKDDLWDFNSRINDEYTLKIDCGSRLDQLVAAKIIKDNNGYYSFRYPYVYYYFLSKYLSDNLSEHGIQDIVSNLISGLDKRKNINTLMFLTHHSKDSRILDGIVNHSKTILSDCSTSQLDEDVLFINNIVDELNLEELVFVESSVQENRVKAAKEREEYEDIQSNHEEELDKNSQDETYSRSKSPLNSLLHDFNLAFKSVDLIGQLTRNYHESLKTGPKINLVTEAIESPLRALEAFLRIMRDDHETLIDMLKKKIQEEFEVPEKSKGDIDLIARQLVFNMVRFVSFSIIKKVSSAIGSRDLIPLIEKAYSNKDKSNAIRLIELSVQLNLGNLGSIEKIKKMSKDFQINTVSGHILRDLIAEYLYMFEDNERNRKAVCSAVKINYIPMQSYQQQKLLSKTS